VKTVKQVKSYYLTTRDMLVIAVLSGIGGVMSTYVGYLGNLLNRIFGVPFGAGQFVAGLHVFWLIVAAGLVRRPGAATSAGLLKGCVELLTGSTHGVAIILVSLVQGIIVDLVLVIVRRHNLAGCMLAGSFATASNVIVFQLLYFSGAPVTYLVFISGLAFVSGLLFAGSFGYSVTQTVLMARPVKVSGETGRPCRRVSVPVVAVTVLLAISFSAGAVCYFAAVFEPPWLGPRLRVEGAVERELSFQLDRFAGLETTITAELKGQVTYVPPQDYTGVPLRLILAEARPLPGAAALHVIATDGYEVEFVLTDVMRDDRMVLIKENDMVRLIAGNYPGGHWVKMVNRLVIR
jgi:energy-coupling factor transport system substrate-specific component